MTSNYHRHVMTVLIRIAASELDVQNILNLALEFKTSARLAVNTHSNSKRVHD